MNSDNIKNIAVGVGAGAVAGLAGSVALSGAEWAEEKLIGRKHGNVAALGIERALHFRVKKKNEEKLGKAVHFGYGAGWGVVRALMSAFGVRGFKATLLHWLLVDLVARYLLPAYRLAPQPKRRRTRNLLIDSAEHALFAVVVGFIFDALRPKS